MIGAFVFRADDATRTRDIHLGKVVLYQLSYVRKSSDGWWAVHCVPHST